MRSDQAARDWRRIARIHSKRSGIDDEIDVRKLHAHYRFFPRYGFKTRMGIFAADKGNQQLPGKLQVFDKSGLSAQ